MAARRVIRSEAAMTARMGSVRVFAGMATGHAVLMEDTTVHVGRASGRVSAALAARAEVSAGSVARAAASRSAMTVVVFRAVMTGA